MAPAELLDKRREKYSWRGDGPAEDKRPDREQHRDYEPSPSLLLKHETALVVIARDEDKRAIVERACLFQFLQVVESLSVSA